MTTATDKWAELVKRCREDNPQFSPAKVIEETRKAYPTIHQRMIEEANTKPKNRGPRIVHITNARAKWKAEIAKLVDRGMTRAMAAVKLAASQPELRDAVIRQANN